MKKLLMGAISATAVMAMGASVSAQDLNKLYKDRTVTILVGYGAGGTYGRTSLLLGAHLSKVIPGNPNIVVQHMPGAGGLKATSYAYNVMPKRGKNFLMPPEMIVASKLLRPKKVKYDVKKFTWLGRVFGQNSTLAVRADSGVKTFSDLKGKEVIVGSSGKGSPTFLIPAMLNALTGSKLKIVTGYRGSRKMQLAMEQGEVQGLALGWTAWDSAKGDWFKGKKQFAYALVQSGYAPQKGIENIPMVKSLLKNDEDKAVARMLASASVIGRGLVLPPGAPKGLVAPLRASFAKITKDKAFIKDAYKRGLQVNPISGKDIQKVVNDLMNIPTPIVKRARGIIFGKKS
ncbi:MAG: hypothetical protein CMM52_07500 [Rhodospirillaceae bacterium]|nr:hypothetical protein [Rhodospirillaceae bacterium]|tara:strand:- start:7820 stop:8854 length:1035 start_codon:yes stop_codon:yes gene_type:complete